MLATGRGSVRVPVCRTIRRRDGMSKASAGLLLYRLRDGRLEVFIAHIGGPFLARKDEGGWSIVKGEYEEDEDPFIAACREFEEETGSAPPAGQTREIGELRQPSGK